MAYAQGNGWTDPAGEFVRAHLEPSPAETRPRPDHTAESAAETADRES